MKAKPKFRVGQAMFAKNVDAYVRITNAFTLKDGSQCYDTVGLEQPQSFFQSKLRPLTRREKGTK